MNVTTGKTLLRKATRVLLVAVIFSMFSLPTMAQNKKGSWEIFIYFGSFFANDVPSAKQFGDIRNYRVSPEFLNLPFPSDPPTSANNRSDVERFNLGRVGGDQSADPTTYPFVTGQSSQVFQPPCNGNFGTLDPNGDARTSFFDECDGDQETRYLYNASGVQTNGELQRDESEFMLGIRGGYNITRHWEIELDIGFGKQRIDLTRNLEPFLRASTNDISMMNAELRDKLAAFYEFTWSNFDWQSIYARNPLTGDSTGEHPAVIASRSAVDSTYNIPHYFPSLPFDLKLPEEGETFEDVTGFINRVFQDPTAFRNRGNQINIDQFTLSGSVNYNFNTKPESRIVPYLSAGGGRLLRNFDDPWDGDDSSFLTYGGGVRFFINEIFSFRAEYRAIAYTDDEFTIDAAVNNVNLPDRTLNFGGPPCVRDNRDIRPPCPPTVVPPDHHFPDLNGGGGNSSVQVDVELDDFYEIRIGFDVVLGGK